MSEKLFMRCMLCILRMFLGCPRAVERARELEKDLTKFLHGSKGTPE